MARVPVAFTLSVGIFSVPAIPTLVLHWSLEAYLLISGGILALCMVLAAIVAIRRKLPPENKASFTLNSPNNWLWAVLLLLSVILAFVSTVRVIPPSGDIWSYLAYVQEHLYADKLGLYEPFYGNDLGFSRMKINGWLLEQAALSRISGIDPVELALKYLAPALVIVGLLAFYALAQALFRNETAALLSGSLLALFFLFYLGSSFETHGGMFVSRITEDKFVARFIFMPIALTFAFLFLREQKLKHLALFAFVCWSVVTVHPLGLVFIGISVAGFGLVYLMVNRRERKAWISVGGIGLVFLGFGLPPAIYLLVTGDSAISVRNSAVNVISINPEIIGQMVFAAPSERLLVLGEGSYMMHPSLLLNPVVLGAYLLGLPFLLWRLNRSLTAQLLLGVLLFVAILLYVPPIATFIGEYIGPGQLWRLAWPIPLAALLTVGWMSWELIKRSKSRLNKFEAVRHVTPFLSLIFVGVLVAGAAPFAATGIEEIYSAAKAEQNQSSCLEPTFRSMQSIVTAPSVVLAEESESSCIAAHVAQATMVSLRSAEILKNQAALEQALSKKIEVPQRTIDVQTFFASSTLGEESIQILQYYKVDYVLLPVNSPINEDLQNSSKFSKIDTPGQRYHLYKVNQLNSASNEGT